MLLRPKFSSLGQERQVSSDNFIEEILNKGVHFKSEASTIDDIVGCRGKHIRQLRKRAHLGDSTHIDIFMFRFGVLLEEVKRGEN